MTSHSVAFIFVTICLIIVVVGQTWHFFEKLETKRDKEKMKPILKKIREHNETKTVNKR